MKEILIVEDNSIVRRLISKVFEDKAVFNITVAGKISHARSYLHDKHVDLIVLDVVLPDGNGLEFCHEIKSRPHANQTKIIILTKKANVKDRVQGFEIGADDYLCKPFYPEELLMRAKRLLGIIDPSTEDVLAFSNLVLNKKNFEAKVGNTTVLLSNTESLIMEYMIESGGITKSEGILLFLTTRRNKRMTKAAMTVCINRLRAKFERLTGRKVIETKYARGYCLNT